MAEARSELPIRPDNALLPEEPAKAPPELMALLQMLLRAMEVAAYLTSGVSRPGMPFEEFRRTILYPDPVTPEEEVS
jgi:hypothetical protein